MSISTASKRPSCILTPSLERLRELEPLPFMRPLASFAICAGVCCPSSNARSMQRPRRAEPHLSDAGWVTNRGRLHGRVAWRQSGVGMARAVLIGSISTRWLASGP